MSIDNQNQDSFSGFLKRRRALARQVKQEASRKRTLLKGLIPLLRGYGVSRAYLFGSITTGSCRRASDIDIYVEGIGPEDYWDLWRALEHHTGEAVDLYYERDDPTFVKKVKERGELIYES